VDAVIDRLVAIGRLEAAPGGLRVPGHEARLTVAQQVARTALLDRLDAQGWEPDPLQAVAEVSEADEDLLGALVREGELVPIEGGERAISRATLARAVEALATLPQPFTAAQARDALGTSRRWALPLLEALDQAGVTRREGDLRHLRP
ncbi:MAG TPA: SelB C-terminal domain-containing protein, partial [Euzebya sp.]|nr:SelB C-terminal domain-containing protein [Euzebya sp.]